MADIRERRGPTRLSAALVLAAGFLGASGGLYAHAGALDARARVAGATPHNSAATKFRAGVTAVGLAIDPVTGGYWILRSSGAVDGVDAPWLGAMTGKIPAGVTVTAIAAGRRGGYLILTSDGGVHNFGTPGHGSDAGKLLAGVTAVSLATDPVTGGYWILRSTGAVDGFHARWHGSLAGKIPAGSTATAIAAAPAGGYRILTSPGGPVPARLAGRVWNVIPTRRKVVALTFDIGPTDGVKSILATLRRDRVRATFFVTGRVARKFPATVRAIAAAGQVVGDHSNNHPHFTAIGAARIRQEVRYARIEIESVAGVDASPWFRFPFGDDDARTISVVNSTGFVPIGWTVDTLGWMGAAGGITVGTVTSRAVGARQPGEIVLMHGGSDTPGDPSTLDADALPIIIRKLRAFGYSFVTVDALGGLGASQRAFNGRVSCFGAASYGSDAGKLAPGVTAVGLAVDPATGGYWILRSTGAVDGFHAPRHGSLVGKIPARATITAMAPGPRGGYLVLTSNGTVFHFVAPS